MAERVVVTLQLPMAVDDFVTVVQALADEHPDLGCRSRYHDPTTVELFTEEAADDHG